MDLEEVPVLRPRMPPPHLMRSRLPGFPPRPVMMRGLPPGFLPRPFRHPTRMMRHPMMPIIGSRGMMPRIAPMRNMLLPPHVLRSIPLHLRPRSIPPGMKLISSEGKNHGPHNVSNTEITIDRNGTNEYEIKVQSSENSKSSQQKSSPPSLLSQTFPKPLLQSNKARIMKNNRGTSNNNQLNDIDQITTSTRQSGNTNIKQNMSNKRPSFQQQVTKKIKSMDNNSFYQQKVRNQPNRPVMRNDQNSFNRQEQPNHITLQQGQLQYHNQSQAYEQSQQVYTQGQQYNQQQMQPQVPYDQTPQQYNQTYQNYDSQQQQQIYCPPTQQQYSNAPLPQTYQQQPQQPNSSYNVEYNKCNNLQNYNQVAVQSAPQQVQNQYDFSQAQPYNQTTPGYQNQVNYGETYGQYNQQQSNYNSYPSQQAQYDVSYSQNTNNQSDSYGANNTYSKPEQNNYSAYNYGASQPSTQYQSNTNNVYQTGVTKLRSEFKSC
ncbi:putative uncharacterized protein DDB_G0271606 isoform X2 [Daktulosphaira vitifoliae]|uniref:putative uncharacterized protein DDB_G0271606 isoform X2 n=1 Tax=Daktulosphaira vitifoliae TaxID=58002 RepID=UPI0021A9D63E|nr:putative uncharacterized protein DDB_G0271606 isoform X2 [Daktulosphaira vitifoliae]